MTGRHALIVWAVLMVVAGFACGKDPARQESSLASKAPQGDDSSRTAAEGARNELPLVVFLGNSLTAGFGLAEEQAFPALVADQLRGREQAIRVVNAGVSGDTTAGGASRLDWLLAQRPDVVVVELGANDGLRGLSLADTESNLEEIVRRSLEAQAKVLLVGMKIPPSYGPEYTAGFEAIFAQLSRSLSIPLIPFLLEGVAANPELNLGDGIHPNAEGHVILAETVTPYLERLLALP